jgi:hypothetical protein
MLLVPSVRIGMGGASALVLYVFLRSDVGDELTTRLFSSELAKAIKDPGRRLIAHLWIRTSAGSSSSASRPSSTRTSEASSSVGGRSPKGATFLR